MSHIWPFVAWIKKPLTEVPDLAVEVSVGEDSKKMTSILISTIIRKIDTYIPLVLLITQNKFDEKVVYEMEKSLNVKIIYSESPSEISSHIKNIIQALKNRDDKAILDYVNVPLNEESR